jgi:phage protein D
MTIVDRSGPGVRITLLDNERAPSGEPLDLAGRIIAFTYEDAEKKADQVSLQLDNFDLALFERAELVGGATLEVSWGYPGNMAPPRRVVVKKLKGFQTLTIEGQATSVLMNREAKTRSWANKSRADVVREIAAEHGYEGEFLDVEDTGEVLDTISQSAETDARFLRRLAAREEYEYFVDDTGFHWRSRDQASAPKHVLTWFSDPGRGDIISVSVESDLQRRAGRVEVRGRDPLAKTTVESAATSATVERATLSDVLEVVDRETGETSLQERNATTSVHPTSAPTPAAAERESAARFRRAERETVKLALQVVGDPTLRAKQVVEVRGISSLLSGKYYVTEAKHVISSSGYVVDLKLTRDGTGARRGAGPNARGQPQGGEPNRTTPATGTSTVTELERSTRRRAAPSSSTGTTATLSASRTRRPASAACTEEPRDEHLRRRHPHARLAAPRHVRGLRDQARRRGAARSCARLHPGRARARERVGVAAGDERRRLEGPGLLRGARGGRRGRGLLQPGQRRCAVLPRGALGKAERRERGPRGGAEEPARQPRARHADLSRRAR